VQYAFFVHRSEYKMNTYRLNCNIPINLKSEMYKRFGMSNSKTQTDFIIKAIHAFNELLDLSQEYNIELIPKLKKNNGDGIKNNDNGNRIKFKFL